eukprot:gene8745-11817_t
MNGENSSVSCQASNVITPQASSICNDLDSNSIDNEHTESYDPTYSNSIYNAKLVQEGDYVFVEPVFGSNQTEISAQMHELLVDFIAEICIDQNISTQANVLTVQLLDRLLYSTPIRKSQFQLVGCCCLFIAGKFEEIDAMASFPLVHLSSYSFSVDDVTGMERFILNELKFDLGSPTRYDFIQLFWKVAKLNPKEKCLALYLTELTLKDFRLNYYRASKVAAAVVHLTLQMLRPSNQLIWSPLLKRFTTYNEFDLHPLVMCIHSIHCSLDEQKSYVMTKFASEENFYVSDMIALPVNDLRFDYNTRRVVTPARINFPATDSQQSENSAIDDNLMKNQSNNKRAKTNN